MTARDDKRHSLNAWNLYTAIFHELFGADAKLDLSPTALVEFYDRLCAPSHALRKSDAEFVATMAREYGPEAGEATADHLRASAASTTRRIEKIPGHATVVHEEPTLTYHGSGEDLATDVHALLNEKERKRFAAKWLERDGCALSATPQKTEEALLVANDILRSCFAVAERMAVNHGTTFAGTNWGSLHEQISKALDTQLAILKPRLEARAIALCPDAQKCEQGCAGGDCKRIHNDRGWP